MADEVNYAGLQGRYSVDYRIAADSMLEALYEDASAIMPYLIRKSLAGYHSTTERFPKKPKLAAAAIADGVDMTNTPYVPQFVNITVGEVGLLITLTDLARVSSLQEAQAYGREMGQAIAEKVLTDIAALMGGFSRSVGSSGVNLTEAQFLEAKALLAASRIREPHVAVLHSQQVFDLAADIGTTLIAGTGLGPRETINQLTPGGSGFVDTWFNTVIISSTAVPTANAGADSAGGIFGANRALGMVEKWATRLEMERNASLRAEEFAATAAYGLGELDDLAGVAIITDR